MTRFARAERQALCDDLLAFGPDAPTLCEGWDTRDLAAHLIIRERRPDLAAGMFLAFVPYFSDRLEREQAALADTDYAALVDQIRSGPPSWNPMSLPAVDERANLLEYFVHHEDIRRGGGKNTPRELDAALESALWQALTSTARLLFRKVTPGVVLVAPGYGRRSAASPSNDSGTVVVTGSPGELVLLAFGRADAANLEFSGDPADVAALRSAQLGL